MRERTQSFQCALPATISARSEPAATANRLTSFITHLPLHSAKPSDPSHPHRLRGPPTGGSAGTIDRPPKGGQAPRPPYSGCCRNRGQGLLLRGGSKPRLIHSSLEGPSRDLGTWKGMVTISGKRTGGRDGVAIRSFELLVILPTLSAIAILLVREPKDLPGNKIVELAVWVLIVGLVELLPVPVWRGTHISLGVPLLMTVGFLYPPPAAALSFNSMPTYLAPTLSICSFTSGRTSVAVTVAPSRLAVAIA